MASPKTDTAAEVEIRIAASPETVFDFFTDPDKMIQWMGRSPSWIRGPAVYSAATSTVVTSPAVST